MPWRSAEQLLERTGEPDQYPSMVPSSMATFAHEQEPCNCASCWPERAKRTKQLTTPAPIIPIAELADVLTVLRPNLMSSARMQLMSRGLDVQLAEDLVQEAIARWFARAPEYRGRGPLYVWLRKTTTWLAASGLRRRDLLDNGCASLDDSWARS